MSSRRDGSTNRGQYRYREGSRVGTLLMLVLIGLVLATVGIVELSTGGGGWLVLTFGVGIAVVAILILVLDPPGGRRPR